jgi:hypothetical protein
LKGKVFCIRHALCDDYFSHNALVIPKARLRLRDGAGSV